MVASYIDLDWIIDRGGDYISSQETALWHCLVYSYSISIIGYRIEGYVSL